MRLLRGGSTEAWAALVADLFIERLKAHPAMRVCLPTGLTPVPIYDRIAEAVAAGQVSFARAEVFLLDEFGGVDPGDPGRCDQMLERFLLSRIDLPSARFHRLDLTGDIDAVCRAYEAAMGDGCDLTLLGIGTNGHVGMNEPGATADGLTRRVSLAPDTIAASARYFGARSAADVGCHDGTRHPATIARDLDSGQRRRKGGDRPADAARAGHDCGTRDTVARAFLRAADCG